MAFCVKVLRILIFGVCVINGNMAYRPHSKNNIHAIYGISTAISTARYTAISNSSIKDQYTQENE